MCNDADITFSFHANRSNFYCHPENANREVIWKINRARKNELLTESNFFRQ